MQIKPLKYVRLANEAPPPPTLLPHRRVDRRVDSPVLIPASRPRACKTLTTSLAMMFSQAMDITKPKTIRKICMIQ